MAEKRKAPQKKDRELDIEKMTEEEMIAQLKSDPGVVVTSETQEAADDLAQAVKEKSKLAQYLSDVKQEMKVTSWPSRPEVAKWSAGLFAVLIFFAAFTFVADTYAIAPLLYTISGLFEALYLEWYSYVVIVLFVLSGVLLFITVMMHQGGDASGISESLVTSMSPDSGLNIVNKNLDKLTIVCGIVFVVCLILLMWVIPTGVIIGS